MWLARLFLLLVLLLSAAASFDRTTAGSARASGAPVLSLCARPGVPVPSSGFPRAISVGRQPWSLAVSDRSGHAFVGLSGRNGVGGGLRCRASVVTLDAVTGRPLRAVPVGAVPPAIVTDDPDGRVFVAGYAESQHPDLDRGSLTSLDLQGRVVSAPQTFGLCPCAHDANAGPLQIRADGPAHRVFVLTSRSALTFDALSGRLLNTVPVEGIGAAGGFPGFVVDERLGRVFIATGAGITVLDARSGSVTQDIDLGQSERGLAEDSRTGRVFVTANRPNTGDCRGAPMQTLSTIDAATGKVVRSVLGSCYAFSPVIVDEPARRVLVGTRAVSWGGVQVSVLDSRNGRVLRSLTIDGSGLSHSAVDPRTGWIYDATQTCTGSTRAAARCQDAVRALQPGSWRIVRTVPVARAYQGIPAVAARAGRLLIANPSSGTVTIVRI